jgi:hypothetical protein
MMALAQWSEKTEKVEAKLGLYEQEFPEDVKTFRDAIEKFRERKGFELVVLDEVYEPYVPGRVAVIVYPAIDNDFWSVSSEFFAKVFEPASCQSRVSVRGHG